MNISFVNPGILVALSLIAIPVIIHLFNFRRFKKVLFTNVRFLQELKQETTSRSRLKHLLVLLTRILAVAFLVLAFAQPYIPAATGTRLTAERVVSIYVDNSFSMEANNREGTLLDIARSTAKDIAGTYKPADRFQLLTNDFDPALQRLMSRDEFLSKLDDIRPGPVSRTMDEVITRQTDILNSSGTESKTAVLISDFQESMAELLKDNYDSAIAFSLIPLTASKESNIMIDSCWFTGPVVQLGQVAEFNVRIRNFSPSDVTAVPVRLTINNAQKAVAGADITGHGYTDVRLSFTPAETGWQKGFVQIVDDPVIFDDKYYFSFYVASESPLLAINGNGGGDYFKALFDPAGYFKLNDSDAGRINYSSLPGNKVIFLNEISEISTGLASELNKYIQQGGVIVVVPDSSADINSYNSFFSLLQVPGFSAYTETDEKVDKLLLEDKIFEGVFSGAGAINDQTDLPLIKGYFINNGNTGSAEVLMRLRSGSPFLTRYVRGKGEIYVFSTPFTGNATNFSRHALFVPVIYRIALLSERPGRLAWFIGKDDQMEVNNVSLSGDMVFHLQNPELNFDVIPGHRAAGTGFLVTFNNVVREAGNYELTLSGSVVAAPSFNYNRAESVMDFKNAEDLTGMIEKLKLPNFRVYNSASTGTAGVASIASEGYPLWKYCIILVLVFLALESLLLKFWKK